MQISGKECLAQPWYSYILKITQDEIIDANIRKEYLAQPTGVYKNSRPCIDP